MAKRLTSVLGIDIGSSKIKICEVKSQGRDPIVTALGIIDTPEGAVDHTGVYNGEAVATALKQVLGEAGVSSPFAVVTIAGQASVLVRTLEVPKMNPTELKDHMQWEINRNIPFAESTVVSDFKPLGDDDPNSPNMDVVMAISPQTAIDTIITAVKKAGRNVAAIDVEPLSLGRSLRTSYEDTLGSQTVCLVEIGAKSASINIYRNGKLLMPRQVPVGGEMFTKAIADSLTLGFAEAEQMKLTRLEIPENALDAMSAQNPFAVPTATQEFQPYNPFSDDPIPAYNPNPAPFDAEPGDFAVPPTDEPPVSAAPVVVDDSEATRLFAAIAPILDEFVSEVRRSIDYFRSRGGEVDALLLCGGGSKIKGMAGYLGKTLNVACDGMDPLRRLNLNVRKVAPQFMDDHRADFAVAIGNGLHIFFD